VFCPSYTHDDFAILALVLVGMVWIRVIPCGKVWYRAFWFSALYLN